MSSAKRRIQLLSIHLNAPPSLEDARGSVSPLIASQQCRAALASPPPGATNRPGTGPAVLVGGMVMDVQAYPSGPEDVQRGGSVPGRVAQSPGGVARNVAEGLSLLLLTLGRSAAQHGPLASPVLVSAVGTDVAGTALLKHCESLGLSTACVARVPNRTTPSVAVVFDSGGEVAACVADVGLLEAAVTADALRVPTVASALAAAPVVMLDGNLSQAALQEACRQATAAGVPVWFEPVSAPKAARAADLLASLTFVSPNEAELAALAGAVRQQQARRPGAAGSNTCSCHGGTTDGRPGGCSCCASRCLCGSGQAAHTPPGAQPAAGTGTAEGALQNMLPDVATLLLAGVRHVVLTMGPRGAALCTLLPGQHAIEVCHIPALPATVVNCSGAGDCLVAGCLFGLARGLSAEASLAHGIAASRAAVESQGNVPARFSFEAVTAGAAEVQGRASRLRALVPAACTQRCHCCRRQD